MRCPCRKSRPNDYKRRLIVRSTPASESGGNLHDVDATLSPSQYTRLCEHTHPFSRVYVVLYVTSVSAPRAPMKKPQAAPRRECTAHCSSYDTPAIARRTFHPACRRRQTSRHLIRDRHLPLLLHASALPDLEMRRSRQASRSYSPHLLAAAAASRPRSRRRHCLPNIPTLQALTKRL